MKKKEAAEAAKDETQARRRDKNRKKNAAKRAKKRGVGNDRPRWWYSDGKAPQGFDDFAKKAAKEKQAKQEKHSCYHEQRRRRSRTQSSGPAGSASGGGEGAHNEDMSKAAWEARVDFFRSRGDVGALQCLFQEDLEGTAQAAKGDEEERAVTRRFRAQSLRFHPDKHSVKGVAEVSSYAAAFQAPSAAYAQAKENYF